MKKAIIAIAVTGMMALALSGCAASGKALIDQKCQGCHNNDKYEEYITAHGTDADAWRTTVEWMDEQTDTISESDIDTLVNTLVEYNSENA